MPNFQLKIGDTLSVPQENITYRIIYIDEKIIEVCQLNIKKLALKMFSTHSVVDSIRDGTIVAESPDRKVIDVSLMSEKEQRQYLKYREICQKIVAEYGPLFEELCTKRPKPFIDDIIKDYDIKKETLRLLYIRYIQSGLDDASLIDTRHTSIVKQMRANYKYSTRPGHKSEDVFQSQIIVDDNVRNQFDEALKEKKSGRCKTYESAYSWLVNKYYSETYMENGSLYIRQKSEANIPSKKQFTNYARKVASRIENDIIKTSIQEVRNDKRLLLGDTYHDVLGPGDLVEIDALEVDVSLVSSIDPNQTIGRPILYLMIDVFTRMILAMAVSLHNNAVLALTNLFLNLADDKYNFCMKYGHEINQSAWLSNIIPRRIRVDRGADFKSDQFARICEELGIDRQLVPAATGSLKGNIEQEFRTLHAAQKPHLDHKGVITKRYDSKHHEQAVLTLEEYTKMAVDFVLHHNTMANDNYPLTADMIRNKVHAIPAELWSYGSMKYGAPRPIINVDMYRFCLLLPMRATLDRTGITLLELSYVNTDDVDLLNRMYALQNKREKIDVRLDPREMGHVYYQKNGILMIAPLNPLKTENEGFSDMTYFEYSEYLKEKRRLKKEGRIQTQRVKNSLHAAQEAIVQSAEANKDQSKKNKTKNISEHRNAEKQKVAHDNSIASRLLEDKGPLIESVSDDKQNGKPKDETKPVPATGLSGFEAAMGAFESDEWE